MKILNNSKSILLLISACLLVTACLPQKPTDRAAVVIFNDMSKPVSYYLELSSSWTSKTNILPNEFDYAIEYDAHINETITKQLSKIKIVAPGCRATLNRDDLVRHMVKDPEGRNTWDLHVTKSLLSSIGCD